MSLSDERFGEMLKRLRLDAGFGLRRFAGLIGERPSRLSEIETGKRLPWKAKSNLRFVANALEIPKGTHERKLFFEAASRPVKGVIDE